MSTDALENGLSLHIHGAHTDHWWHATGQYLGKEGFRYNLNKTPQEVAKEGKCVCAPAPLANLAYQA